MLNLSNHFSVVIGVEAAPVIQILDLFNPNPFLINDYNVVGNDGHVRFVYSNPNGLSGKIDIFDFSMDKVIHLDNSNPFTLEDNQNEMIWNGRNEYGEKISNGVYFCRLSLNGKYSWTKLVVVN